MFVEKRKKWEQIYLQQILYTHDLPKSKILSLVTIHMIEKGTEPRELGGMFRV